MMAIKGSTEYIAHNNVETLRRKLTEEERQRPWDMPIRLLSTETDNRFGQIQCEHALEHLLGRHVFIAQANIAGGEPWDGRMNVEEIRFSDDPKTALFLIGGHAVNETTQEFENETTLIAVTMETYIYF